MSEEEIYNYLISFISSKIKQHKLNLQDMAGFNLGYLLTEDLQKAAQGLMDLRKAEKEKNKELEKYDYRKIKLDEKDKISSIHFTKEQLDLMNLGIALYVGIPKILADKEDEETDV